MATRLESAADTQEDAWRRQTHTKQTRTKFEGNDARARREPIAGSISEIWLHINGFMIKKVPKNNINT